VTGACCRSLPSVALDGYDSSKNAIGGGVIFLTGIAARDDAAGGTIGDRDPVHSEAVLAARQRHIALPQFTARSRGDYHRIAIQDIRLHALTLCAKSHLRTTIEERLANRRKFRAIPLLDGITLRHGK
jgi:hypothetical protein